MFREAHFSRESKDDRVWEEHVATVQVLFDVMDVFLRDSSLIANELACFVSIQPRNIRDLVELLTRQGEQVKRILWVLLDQQSRPAEDARRPRRHLLPP